MSDTVRDKTDDGGEMVPVGQPDIRPPELSKDWQKKIIGSYSIKRQEDRESIFRATLPCDRKIEDIITHDQTHNTATVLDISSWLSAPVLDTDEETGEVKGWYQTCIFLADGTRVSSGSHELLKSLMQLAAFEGYGPYNPPKRMVVKSARSRKGRVFHFLDYAPPDTIRTDD